MRGKEAAARRRRRASKLQSLSLRLSTAPRSRARAMLAARPSHISCSCARSLAGSASPLPVAKVSELEMPFWPATCSAASASEKSEKPARVRGGKR